MSRSPARKATVWKKVLFSGIVFVLFFGALESALRLAGVRTLLETEDPSRGFSGLISVYERDGETYRTRGATVRKTFNDQSFPGVKPANGFRIFTVGGASAYGYPWGADAAHPDLRVEAINAAGLAAPPLPQRRAHGFAGGGSAG